MEKERIQLARNSRTIQQRSAGSANIMDNRPDGSRNYLSDTPLQRQDDEEEEGVLQGKMEDAPRRNETGLPDNLKAGVESLSGYSLDDVRVHYNSSKPATVQALAYTQGTDIHVAPGQEKHLPHEAWHVAQQMAGRVSPTTNINGMPVNDNVALEHEADVMGEKAVQCKAIECNPLLTEKTQIQNTLQRRSYLGKRNLQFGFSGSSGKSRSSHQGGSSQGSSDSSVSPLVSSTSPSSLPTIGLDYSSRSSGSRDTSSSAFGSKRSTSASNLEVDSSSGAGRERKVKKFVGSRIIKDRLVAGRQGQTDHTGIIPYDKDSETIGQDGGFHFNDMGFYHAHFWFNHRYLLPYGNATDLNKGEWGNNIGYGGTLYSDPSGPSNYDLIGPISATPLSVNPGAAGGELTDYQIVKAMWILAGSWRGGYNVLTHNCQHWADAVIRLARTIDPAEAEREMSQLEDMITRTGRRVPNGTGQVRGNETSDDSDDTSGSDSE